MKASVDLSLDELRCIENCVLERSRSGNGGHFDSQILRKLEALFGFAAHVGEAKAKLTVKEV